MKASIYVRDGEKYNSNLAFQYMMQSHEVGLNYDQSQSLA